MLRNRLRRLWGSPAGWTLRQGFLGPGVLPETSVLLPRPQLLAGGPATLRRALHFAQGRPASVLTTSENTFTAAPTLVLGDLTAGPRGPTIDVKSTITRPTAAVNVQTPLEQTPGAGASAGIRAF